MEANPPPGDETAGQWDSPCPLDSGMTLHSRLAGLSLAVTRLDMEWQLRFRHEPWEAGADDRWRQWKNYVVPGDAMTLERHLHKPGEAGLRFVPALADRPVVMRPYHPLHVPPDADCQIYVGTSVWLRVTAGRQRVLADLPVEPLSLTWVGRTTMEGDLCYSASTWARLVLAALPRRPWRAVTPVRIRNRSPSTPLVLERFSLPVTHLRLYGNEVGQLWTPAVTVHCESDLAPVRVELDDKPPAEAGETRLLAPPREAPGRGGLVRALDRLFG